MTNAIPVQVTLNGETFTVLTPSLVEVTISQNVVPFVQQNSDWLSVANPTQILNKPDLTKRNVRVVSSSTVLLSTDEVVVFTASGDADLPVATGSGQTYRVVARGATVVITPNGTDTIKGFSSKTIINEDLTFTDTEIGIWE